MNRSRGGYALTELELPGIRNRRPSAPSSVLSAMAQSVVVYCNTFTQLYSHKYRQTTLLLLAAWTAAIFVFHGLTIYISDYSKAIEQNHYNRLTVSLL